MTKWVEWKNIFHVKLRILSVNNFPILFPFYLKLVFAAN